MGAALALVVVLAAAAPVDRVVVLQLVAADDGDGPFARELSSRAAMHLADVTSLPVEQGTAPCGDMKCAGRVATEMGAQRVLFGRLGREGGRFALKIELFDSSTSATIAFAWVRGGTRAEVQKKLPAAVHSLANAVGLPPRGATIAGGPGEGTPAPAPFRWGLVWGTGAMALGALGIGTGIVSALVLSSGEANLRSLGEQYEQQPTADARIEIVDAQRSLALHRALHTFVFAPLCCASVPACGLGGAYALNDGVRLFRDDGDAE